MKEEWQMVNFESDKEKALRMIKRIDEYFIAKHLVAGGSISEGAVKIRYESHCKSMNYPESQRDWLRVSKEIERVFKINSDSAIWQGVSDANSTPICYE